MANIYKLHNQVKHYEWGSPDFIPHLMGLAANGAPCAELWMGTHPNAPSQIIMPSGEISLAEQYDALPFLFKLLAAQKPLSIQAHPNITQACEGFERENKSGLALGDPNRNYKDPNHKPEIICALSPFTGMCGFREPDEIRRLLDIFIQPSSPALLRESFAPLLEAFENPSPNFALRYFLKALFGISPTVRAALTEFILSLNNTSEELRLMRDFAGLYPSDPAIIAPVYLNIFYLEPGEAIFLPAGILHAYISGFGVELMTNSDNVLRGGLTAKHIDVLELMNVLDFSPFKPRIIRPELQQSKSDYFTYPTPCEEFSLTVMRGVGTTEVFFRNTPSICIVTKGEVSMDGVILKQGESAFIPPDAALPLELQGHYTLYIASAS